MRYSRKQLDKAGDCLLLDPFKREEALAKINQWREDHIPVLREIYEEVLSLFKSKGIAFELSSMRIKRKTSIEAKLKNNQMKLGGMFDIGGLRFVFATIEDMDKANEALKVFQPKNFTKGATDRDYVKNPKPSGYRSVHYVYKYSSDDEVYNGLSVELQIRTKLQHSWAMAVETASLVANTTLKADLGDHQDWRGFLRLVSAIFARKECRATGEIFQTYSEEDFCRDLFEYEDAKLIDTLKALRVSVDKDFGDLKGFCVLVVNFRSRIVHFNTFADSEEKKAAEEFDRIEQGLNADETALLVAIDKMKEIRDAYPSYFLDTKYFLDELDLFRESCNVYRD